jgi:glycosyltransferase involved in cell wall biosynthesis
MESTKTRSKVTILIKALNEEARIAACLEAAVREARSVGGDVLLVDSLSTDRTVDIAREFPVRIVQFSNKEDCGCGAATQLGYQWADADFVYVLDADMELADGFLRHALSILESDQTIAGVGGKLVDTAIRTVADLRRSVAANALVDDVDVDELGGGGLYRSTAIDEVGYLAHRWLAAFEEAELGMRLRSSGWRLRRISRVAVFHEGHNESNFFMLRRLWGNGRAQATGNLIRSALGKAWLMRAVKKNGYAFVVPIVYVSAILAAFASHRLNYSPFFFFGSVWLLFFTLLWVRKRRFSEVLKTMFLWHFYAVAATIGIFQTIGDPRHKIDSYKLKDDFSI